MLTEPRQTSFAPAQSQPSVAEVNPREMAPYEARPKQGRLSKALQIEWLGQTLASLCWIASVLAYGITSAGDWLQLAAASAWLLANLAAIATADSVSTG